MKKIMAVLALSFCAANGVLAADANAIAQPTEPSNATPAPQVAPSAAQTSTDHSTLTTDANAAAPATSNSTSDADTANAAGDQAAQ